MADTAPIALFVFNRADHAAATLDALKKNELARDSELTVFCDGPRGAEDEPKVRSVRDLVKQTTGFGRLTVVERPQNLGLARSVITGVTQILESHDKVIVVEDDLITTPFFLSFMNDGLRRYADDERVWSLCAYAYPVWSELPGAVFLPGANPWGWATWRRAWELFEQDQTTLLRALYRDDLVYEFDLAGSFPHTAWLIRSSKGEGDSWALRWIGSAIVHHKLTLYPARSLVRNIGMDGSGTHAPDTSFYDGPLADSRPPLPEAPPETNQEALDLLRKHHIRWRRTFDYKEGIYYRLAALVPRRFERMLYSARMRRAMRKHGIS